MTTCTTMLTVQFRGLVSARLNHGAFAVLADALAWGLATKEPFDISSESGAIVWAWEMRP